MIKTSPFNLLLPCLAILILTFFSACQKEGIEEFEAITSEAPITTLSSEEDDIPDLTKATDLALTIDSGVANARSSRRLIYSKTFTVDKDDWKLLHYKYHQLPDPKKEKVVVYIKPISGNPDLYFYGYKENRSNKWRLIRKSTRSGSSTDSDSYRQSGFFEDELAYMAVKGRTKATYKLEIYFERVSCKEYLPAVQAVYKDLTYYCGCDGKTYTGTNAPWVAGLTSWTSGRCNGNGGQGNNDKPTISFLKPTYSTVQFSGQDVYVKVAAADSDGIANVKLYVNGQFVRTENFAPYEWGKPHTSNDRLLNNVTQRLVLRAVATDNKGNQSEVTMELAAPLPPLPPADICDSDPESIDWLMNILRKDEYRTCGADVYCCTLNGKRVLTIIPIKAICGDLEKFVYDSDGRLVAKYGGFAGTPPPSGLNCPDNQLFHRQRPR